LIGFFLNTFTTTFLHIQSIESSCPVLWADFRLHEW